MEKWKTLSHVWLFLFCFLFLFLFLFEIKSWMLCFIWIDAFVLIIFIDKNWRTDTKDFLYKPTIRTFTLSFRQTTKRARSKSYLNISTCLAHHSLFLFCYLPSFIFCFYLLLLLLLFLLLVFLLLLLLLCSCFCSCSSWYYSSSSILPFQGHFYSSFIFRS